MNKTMAIFQFARFFLVTRGYPLGISAGKSPKKMVENQWISMVDVPAALRVKNPLLTKNLRISQNYGYYPVAI
jgi:hypothetical protein